MNESSATPLQSVNPATGKVIRSYEKLDDAALARLLDKADAGQKQWMERDFPERAEKLRRAAEMLKENADDYARLMAGEMGKPLSQGRAESEKCAWVCDYYADNAPVFLKDEIVETGAEKSYIHYAPLGVIFAVMPWNFPFWQVFRFAAGTLMAGNGIVLKHAENVTGCALAIEAIFKVAGFPENLFRSLRITRHKARQVINHPVIKAITLTGSVEAGREVASLAGAALKKTIMELGGSDPFIVLADANMDDAVDKAVQSRLLSSGQTCISAKRFIVAEEIHDEFVRRFVQAMKSKTMGDPIDDPDLGPQARDDLRRKLHDQVIQSAKKGAAIRLGGTMPQGEGFYYPPTVLTEVTRDMPVFREETFGPVAAVIKAESEDAAIDIANDTAYGLGAAIFTRDVEKGERIARDKLHAGSCFVNDFVKSDPRLPFGGIKQSGYGRELHIYGAREFTNVKSVCAGR